MDFDVYGRRIMSLNRGYDLVVIIAGMNTIPVDYRLKRLWNHDLENPHATGVMVIPTPERRVIPGLHSTSPETIFIESDRYIGFNLELENIRVMYDHFKSASKDGALTEEEWVMIRRFQGK